VGETKQKSREEKRFTEKKMNFFAPVQTFLIDEQALKKNLGKIRNQTA